MAKAFSVLVNIGGKVLPSLGAAIRATESAVSGIGRHMTAVNARTTATINNFGKGVETAGKRLQSAGAGLSASVTAPLGILGKIGFDAAYQFEKTANAVQAVGDMTGEQRDKLKKYAKDLNAAFPFSNAQILSTAEELAKAGFNYEQVYGSLKSTLNLASAGDIDLKSSAEISSNILTAMNLPRKTAGEASASLAKVADALSYAANRSNTDVRLMGETFKYVGPMARAAGLSIADVSAASMIMANNGIKGSEAGVAMRSALVRMVRPTKPMIAALERLNLNLGDFVKSGRDITSQDIIGSLGVDGIDASGAKSALENLLKDKELQKSPGELIKRMTEAVSQTLGSTSIVDKDKLSDSISSAVTTAGSQVDLAGFMKALKERGASLGDIARIFDARQGARLITLLFEGDLAKAAEEVAKNAEGAANRMREIRMQGIVGEVGELSAAWENLWVSIGESGVLKDVGRGLKWIADGLESISQRNPALLRFATWGAMAAAAAGPFLLIAGTAARVLGPMARGLGLLGAAATTGLAARLVSVASGVRALAIASALGAAGRLRAMAAGLIALTAVGGSRAALGAVAASVASLGRSLLLFPLTMLKAIGVAMWGLVANPVGIAIAGIVLALTALGVWVANNWSGLKDFLQGFANGFRDALPPSVTSAIDTVGSGLKSVYNYLSQLLGPLNASQETWRGWGYAAGLAVGAVVDAVVNLPSKIATAATSFATAMGSLAQQGWNAFVNLDWAGLGKAIVQAIIDGVAAMGSALAGKLGEIASAGAGKVKSLFSFGGGAAPAASGKPTVADARADGGPVSAGKTYLVGERGPELFTPGSSGGITPNDKLNRLSSPASVASAGEGGRSVSIGDTSVTVNLTGGGDDAGLARKVADAVRAEIRRMESDQRGLLSD